MAAPTNAAYVKKALANPEPSTHGPMTDVYCVATTRPELGAKRHTDDVESIDVNDPLQTSAELLR